MEEEILRVENIEKKFGGVVAIDNISLSVHKGEICCLVGENGSGKSTLIKIISGVYAPDAGDIYINGNHYKKLTPIESIHEGIQVIYQDFSLFPNLSVAENIAINEQLASGSQLINWKKINEVAAKGLARINVSLPLDAIVSTLSTAERQLVAIAKALLANAHIIVMDEPTTALTQKEVNSLFKLINSLKEQGISTLFVSHKLDEVSEISERTIIFRNGQKIIDVNANELDVKKMEFYMTGHEIDDSAVQFNPIDENATPLLKVEDLNLLHGFSNINFDLKAGEVLGITGLLGSGRTELALSLFGELPVDSGKIFINGKEVFIKSIADAVKEGIGFVPEDRIREGLFLDHSITNNIVIGIIDKLKDRLHFIDNHKKSVTAEDWIKKLEIKTPSGELPVKNLSGGNQQRVVLAKWLASNPKVLILNNPTVGVDVGSKAEIHELIHSLATQGLGILMISDDVPEVTRTCHRVLLMKGGKIVEEFNRENISEQRINSELVRANAAEKNPLGKVKNDKEAA
jgi:simple sugar transport system ATP-binding protein